MANYLFYLLWCVTNNATSANSVLLWIAFLVYTFLISAYERVAYAMFHRDYVNGCRPVLRQRGCWTWSHCQRGDLGRYGWMRDEIGGGTWSQWVPPSVHGTYSGLAAVLLGARSYAKLSIVWVIAIMYITVHICMFYLSYFINLACHFYVIFYLIHLTKRTRLTQVIF